MNLSILEIFEVLAFAADRHKYQRRAGYEPLPYVNHLIKVAEALVEIGKETDRDLIIAAVLHDILEDTETTFGELKNKYGEKVATTVQELTDNMELAYDNRKQLQIDHAHELSEPARKIRIADKASNIHDIFSYELDWSKQKKMAYLDNAVQVVNKIRGVNPALENWFDERVEVAKKTMTDSVG